MLDSLTTAYRSWAFKVTTWLILAAIAAGLTVMVWIASAVKPGKSVAKHTNADQLTSDPTALLLSNAPQELDAEVQPLKFDAVIRDMRNYPKEFKDSRFIKANSGKWTVQVMNVVEHEVVTDYLNSREDREKFNYFRIVDKNEQKRFVVTYGTFGSAQEAIGASKIINFNLPKDVSAFPEEFKMYLPQMDEYEVAPPLRDTGKSAPRDVKLRSTPKLLPAPKAKPTTQKPKPVQENTNKPAVLAKPTRSIEGSGNRNDTLSIQEGKILRDKTTEQNDVNTHTEPKVINTRNNDSQTEEKPKEVRPKKSEDKTVTHEKTSTRETNSNKSTDSTSEVNKQKSDGN